MTAILKRIFLFSLAPLLSAVSSLIALPEFTARFGPQAWGAVALGLSVGTAFSVLVELGWGLDGPPRVAIADDEDRKRIFALATATKLSVFPIASLAALTVSGVLIDEFRLAAVVSSFAGVVLGLNANWFFIGIAAPARLVVSDALPKCLAAAIAAVALTWGAPLMTYPMALLVGAGVSPLLSWLIVIGPSGLPLRTLSPRQAWEGVRSQMTALRGRAASAIYLSLPTTLLGAVSMSSVPLFAAVDRLQRMLLTVLQVLPNAMVSWATELREEEARWRRIRLAIAMNAVLGSLAALAWALLAPYAADVIFAGTFRLTTLLTYSSASLVFLTVMSRAIGGIGLVAFGAINQVSHSAVIGAIVGCISILVAGALFGAPGALLGLLAAETTVLTWQIIALFRIRKSRKE